MDLLGGLGAAPAQPQQNMFGGGDLLGNSMPQQDAFGGFNSGQPEFPSFTAYEDEALLVGIKDEIQPDGGHMMTCVFKNKS
jgi:hypothetical protein